MRVGRSLALGGAWPDIRSVWLTPKSKIEWKARQSWADKQVPDFVGPCRLPESTGGKHTSHGRIQPSTLSYLAGTLFLPGGSAELLPNC